MIGPTNFEIFFYKITNYRQQYNQLSRNVERMNNTEDAWYCEINEFEKCELLCL